MGDLNWPRESIGALDFRPTQACLWVGVVDFVIGVDLFDTKGLKMKFYFGLFGVFGLWNKLWHWFRICGPKQVSSCALSGTLCSCDRHGTVIEVFYVYWSIPRVSKNEVYYVKGLWNQKYSFQLYKESISIFCIYIIRVI